MPGPGIRDYCALAATTASSGLGLLLPLYLVHMGHPVGLVGLLTGLGAIASLLSRIPLPLLYRPERSRQILLATSAVGMISSAVMPWAPDLVWFTLVLVVNRVMGGIATAVYIGPLSGPHWRESRPPAPHGLLWRHAGSWLLRGKPVHGRLPTSPGSPPPFFSMPRHRVWLRC